MAFVARAVGAAAAAGAALLSTSAYAACDSERDERLYRALLKLRPGEAAMREKWRQDEDGWHKLPPRAWPERQPDADSVPTIRDEAVNHECLESHKDGSVVLQRGKLSDTCQTVVFDLATALVFNAVDAEQGLALYRQLGENGHSEAMVATGVVLVEGLGVPSAEQDGVGWLERAVAAGSAQGAYELGSLYYTGLGGVVPEDEDRAYALFEQAAAKRHTGGMFMVADHLLEVEEGNGGSGGDVAAEARAVEMMHAAAERGHRYARQRIRQMLDAYARDEQS